MNSATDLLIFATDTLEANPQIPDSTQVEAQRAVSHPHRPHTDSLHRDTARPMAGTGPADADTLPLTTEEDSLHVRTFSTAVRPDSLQGATDSLQGSFSIGDPLPEASEDSLLLPPQWWKGLYGGPFYQPTDSAPRHHFGYAVESRTRLPLEQPIVVVPLILSALVIIWILHHLQGRVKQLLRDFFFPAPHTAHTAMKPQGYSYAWVRAASILSISLSLGTLLTWLVKDLGSLWFYTGQHLLIWSVCVAGLLLYFRLRERLAAFLQWTFFSQGQRVEWIHAQSAILCLEALALFPLVSIWMSSEVNPQNALFGLLFILVFTRILSFYKTLAIFLGSFHGFVHIFVYFCTLEIMPLLVAFKLLSYLSVITVFS